MSIATEDRPDVAKYPGGEALYRLRHSAAHVLATAVTELFPGVKVAGGPPIDNGFYYDFAKDTPFTPEDLEKIEARMREIVAANQTFEYAETTREEAEKRFAAAGEKYKLHFLSQIPAGAKVTYYTNDGFVDLCRGPHVASTGDIKAFKLTHVAGAYWLGSERNEMLQRIYGTAFPTAAEMDEYLQRIEESLKRDHRRLGRELDLFSIQEEVGPASCCGIRGSASCATSSSSSGRKSTGSAVTSSSTRRTSRARSCTRSPATCRTTPTSCTRRW
jgi:threonyl-tRNA synthetase